MSDVVLDASAVLAAIQDEPGGRRVTELGHSSLISAVNYAEVRTRLVDRAFETVEIDELVNLVPMTIVEFDAGQAVAAAELRRNTRAAGLSLGDRACLALAASREAVALTADRTWKGIDVPIQIELVR